MNQIQRKAAIIAKVSQALNKNIPVASVSQSLLRLETVLTTQNQIVFNPLINGANLLASEVRLNLNDAFVITHIGLRVAKVASATPTTNQLVNKKMYTNPNPFIFDGAAGDVNISGIYNSQFSFGVNQNTYIPNLNTSEFLRYGDMQEGSATSGITGPVVTARMANDSKISGNYGFLETDEILITGTQQIVPAINLPAGYTASFTEASETNYAILLIKGYLISNYGTFSAS